MRVCEYCGTEFVPKQKRSKYCSRDCSLKAYRDKQSKVEEKECLICGRTFLPSRNGVKYCSDVCRMKAADNQRQESIKRKQVEKNPIKCKNCGEEFLPRHRNQLFCCKKCGEVYRYEHAPKKERTGYKPRKCVICGKEYIPTTGQQKYCGVECSKEAIRRNHSKYQYSKKPPKETKPKTPKRKMSPASRRWEKMSLQERAIECTRHHISYGKAQVAATNNTLPEDWGLHR